ncbi:unnamed protein product [Cuscuta epithymum]|uniref:Phytocyanin domain-containing protein n=1 Tax=Cuscuta epithymum TaxID=186058 RepID=A0AAV0DJ24_9ASTE|nr:unnamed protein product [Cuscuta epithymum]
MRMDSCRDRLPLMSTSLGILVFGILTAVAAATEVRPPRTFHAGGKDGWRLVPDDGLNRWAESQRFRVNDTIVFEYEKGKDSVLVVRKREYYHCNATGPIHNLTDGHSTLKFTRHGTFYFISGFADHCLKGQRLAVTVMSPYPHHRHATKTPPPPSPSPSPQTPPPAPATQTPPPATTASEQPPRAGGDGWVVAPAPAPKNSGQSSVFISWGVTVLAGLFVCLV